MRYMNAHIAMGKCLLKENHVIDVSISFVRNVEENWKSWWDNDEKTTLLTIAIINPIILNG